MKRVLSSIMRTNHLSWKTHSQTVICHFACCHEQAVEKNESQSNLQSFDWSLLYSKHANTFQTNISVDLLEAFDVEDCMLRRKEWVSPGKRKILLNAQALPQKQVLYKCRRQQRTHSTWSEWDEQGNHSWTQTSAEDILDHVWFKVRVIYGEYVWFLALILYQKSCCSQMHTVT